MPVIYRFTDILRKTWKNGFVEVEVARDLSARYALKYMQKDYNNKTKQLKSIRLGHDTINKYREHILGNPDVTEFTILTKDGTYKDIPVYGYIMDMIYPNVNKSVPKELRDTFFRVSNFINLSLEEDLPLEDRQILELHKMKYNDYFKLFGYENIKTPLKFFELNYSLVRYYEDINEIEDANLDLTRIFELDYIRQEHNRFVLMHNMQSFDIPHEVAKLNIRITKELNKERDEE